MFNKKLEKKIDGLEQQILELRNSVPQLKSMNNAATLPKPLFTNEDERKKAVYALNLVTVSVSQIVDYEDLVVLEQEYDAILNNINLENIIHDEPLLDILKQILDVITFFKIQAKEKEFVEREYQQKMKNAIWSAVPNIGLIVAGGNPVTMAISLASQVGIGYMNYRKEKANTSLEKDKQMWQLEKSAIEQLNGLRRELFSTAWKLADRYNFRDEYRLTEKQIDQYNKILMDNDPLRRFERLDVIKKDFEAFPPFWYNLGHTAKEIADNARNEGAVLDKETNKWIWDDDSLKCRFDKYKKEALDYYKKFNDNYIELMREDVIYSACALEQIPLLIDDGCDKAEIRKLLNNAIRLAGNNFDILQQSVLVSLYLNDNEAAKNTLRRLVNEDYNTVFNAQLLSKIYIAEKNKVEYDMLSERVGNNGGGNYLLPYPEENESEAEQTQEFYEQQKINLKSQLTEFFERFTEKLRIESYRLIPALAEENDLFFTKDNFLDVAGRKIKTSPFDSFEFFENYIKLLDEKCKILQDSGMDDVFEDNEYDIGDTVKELAQLISSRHLQEVKKEIENFETSSENDENGEVLLNIVSLLNGDKSKSPFSPTGFFNDYCDYILKNIDNLSFDEIEKSKKNQLSLLEAAVNKLYTSQKWAMPYYAKKIGNNNSTNALVTIDMDANVIVRIKRKKQKKFIIKESLNEIEIEKNPVIRDCKQIQAFMCNIEIAGKFAEQPVAILKTKKAPVFIFFAEYFWYFKKGFFSFCLQYSYNTAFESSERNEKGDEFTIKAKPEKFIMQKAGSEKNHPTLTSEDANIEEFEAMMKKLAEM